MEELGRDGTRPSQELKTEVGLCGWQQILQVIEYVLGLTKPADVFCAKFLELIMTYGDDDTVVTFDCGFAYRSDSVFVFSFGCGYPRVIYIDLDVVFAQLFYDIDNLSVTQIGAVFLEGQPHDQYLGSVYMDALFHHAFDQLGHNIGSHAVVQAATGEDDFWMVADGLGFMGQVVGVNADAVTADQAWTEWQEVPFGTGSLQDSLGVDTHFVEDHCQFVDQRDIQIALGVFNHLGCFSYFDAAGFVGAGDDDFVVQRIYQVRHLGSRTGGDFLDVGNAVFFVAGVDALGTVAGKEVHVVFQARNAFQYRYALFFCGARIDGGFVDNDIALLQRLPDGFGCFAQWGQIWTLVLVNRRRNRNDVDVGCFEICRGGGVGQLGCLLHLFIVYFQRAVVTFAQGVDAGLVDIKADDGAFFAEFHCEGQADVAETDDGEFDVFQFVHGLYPVWFKSWEWFLKLRGRGRSYRESGAAAAFYSTVTDLARFLGLSTSVPFTSAT